MLRFEARRPESGYNPGGTCTGSFSPSTTPKPASLPSTGWRGSTPGGPCLYRRVLVPVRANGTVLPGWLYVVGDRWPVSFKELTAGIWR